MAGGGGGRKILLAKPATPRVEGGVKLMREREDDGAARARLPHGSLNLLSDTWEFLPERSVPLLSDNTDFTVVGVLGAPGVGKSTILNQLYGFDGTASSSVLPPFGVQTEEHQAMARHCSVGIELRASVERLLLLDTQPVFSASVLSDLMRPDGSSAVSALAGETMSAELAHELMGLQLGLFLCSVCHVVLLITEGMPDSSLLRLMQTVEMLKQGIPDPSLPPAGSPGSVGGALDAESGGLLDESSEFFADTVLVFSKLQAADCCWPQIRRLETALANFFPAPSFRKNAAVQYSPPQFPTAIQAKQAEGVVRNDDGAGQEMPAGGVNFFVLPLKGGDEILKKQHESYASMLCQFRDQVLSMPRRPFARPMSERDWLRNAARIWDLLKKSPVLADYSKMLQGSGLYRRWATMNHEGLNCLWRICTSITLIINGKFKIGAQKRIFHRPGREEVFSTSEQNEQF